MTCVILSGEQRYILDYVFNECTSLVDITIPDSVISIGEGAFAGCTSLSDITIPDSVTSIDDYAFSGCTGLPGITIPDGVTSIGENVFGGCTSLSAIKVSAGNTAYASLDGVLFNFDMTELVCYPNGKNDSAYEIPSGVTSIGRYAFRYCTSLTCITIPDGVTSIGKYAFYSCTSLTSIVIPESMASIGMYAFRGCTSLSDVYYAGSEDDWGRISISYYNTCLTSATIHYNYTG